MNDIALWIIGLFGWLILAILPLMLLKGGNQDKNDE